MQDLNKKLQKATPHTNRSYTLKFKIEKTDRTIDQKVYKLYNLPPQEIGVIEGSK